MYVKKPNKAEDEPNCMKREWRPESIDSTVVQGKGDFSINKIVDKKDIANDASDYLWLMTRFFFLRKVNLWCLSLYVNTLVEIVQGLKP